MSKVLADAIVQGKASDAQARELVAAAKARNVLNELLPDGSTALLTAYVVVSCKHNFFVAACDARRCSVRYKSLPFVSALLDAGADHRIAMGVS